MRIYLIAFEIIVFTLGGYTLFSARRRGIDPFCQLAAGMFFGVLLEWATIRQLHAYHYGSFLVTIGDVPLVIGIAWGLIIYSVRLWPGRTALPPWARPILDGLLALNIDLAMDAVAIRLGMWDWGMGFQAEYFGVPYANFWAWFWVVTSFSAGLDLLARHRGRAVTFLAPVGAILIGLLGVLITNAVIVDVVPHRFYPATVASILTAALLAVIMLGRRRSLRRGESTDPLAAVVPLVFHSYFLIAGLISGVILSPGFLLLASLLMLATAGWLHWRRGPGRGTGITFLQNMF